MKAHLGKTIKKILEQRNMTGYDLAKMIDRDHRTVYDMLKKKYLHTRLLEKISIALEHDLFQYLYDPENLPGNKVLEQQLVEQQTQIQQLKNENKTLKDVIEVLKKK